MPKTKKYTDKEAFASTRYTQLKSRVKHEYTLEKHWQRADFINWYISNNNTCCYCDCSIYELLEFHHLTEFKRKKTRGKTLEVERKDGGVYCSSNCELCCHLCNNAKSDVFSYDEFLIIGKTIGDVMRRKISCDTDMIPLSYEDTSFDVTKLVAHLKANGLQYIIIGQQRVVFDEHTKPQSLDYWIRSNIAKSTSTAQASVEVVSKICETKYFEFRTDLKCPDTERACRGLILLSTN
jgi:hypothetical protein